MAAAKKSKTPAKKQGTILYETLEDLYKDYIRCERCGLCQTSKGTVVPARGNAKAKIMIVGEGPGEEEHIRRKPFVGPSGMLLASAISTCVDLIGDERLLIYRQVPDSQSFQDALEEHFYITNAEMCWCGKSRKPTAAEYRACRERLLNEIYLVDPDMLILLGKEAVNALTNKPISVTQMNGEMIKVTVPGRLLSTVTYPALVVVHPSFVLRNGPESKWAEDFFKAIVSGIAAWRKMVTIVEGEKE